MPVSCAVENVMYADDNDTSLFTVKAELTEDEEACILQPILADEASCGGLDDGFLILSIGLNVGSDYNCAAINSGGRNRKREFGNLCMSAINALFVV